MTVCLAVQRRCFEVIILDGSSAIWIRRKPFWGRTTWEGPFAACLYTQSLKLNLKPTKHQFVKEYHERLPFERPADMETHSEIDADVELPAFEADN